MISFTLTAALKL